MKAVRAMGEPGTEVVGLEDEELFEASLVGLELDVTDETGEATTVIEAMEPLEPAAPASHQPAWVGKCLGRFRLMRLLGQGTMGMVIQAEDKHLGRIVALKVLRKKIEGMDAAKAVDQFLREARAAAAVDHPNIARVYEINEHDGWWYIATEYLEGGSLRDVIKAGGPLSPPRAASIIADAAAGLAAAHQAGVIHRDIKPANLMLTRTGRCKLVDFGLVRVEDPNDPFDFTNLSVGTPRFMSPEVVQRHTPTPAVDVYSLGVTLYYALAGRSPYDGKSVKAILRQHLKAERPDARRVCGECPESLASLIRRAMALDPAERPSAGELSAALRAETIGVNPDELGLPLGYTQAGEQSNLGTHFGSRLVVIDPSTGQVTAGGATMQLGSVVRSPWWRSRAALVAAVGAVLIGVALGWWYYRTHTTPPVRSENDFADRFPDAPQQYGQLSQGATMSGAYFDTPPFSWHGKVDPQGGRFVAHRQGRLYFSVDDERGWLIPAGAAVFFDTDEQAELTGRTRAAEHVAP